MLPVQGAHSKLSLSWRLHRRLLTTGLGLSNDVEAVYRPTVQPPTADVPEARVLLDRSVCIDHGRLGDRLPQGDGSYVSRMLGPTDTEIAEMLKVIGMKSLDELVDKVIPYARSTIVPAADDYGRGLPEEGLSERRGQELLAEVLGLNEKGWRSFLGAHTYNTHTPAVLVNNVLLNPAWYSAYTPYQAEISQGRLEALYNFQTIFAELTGLPTANAGLLDVASATVEAVLLAKRTCHLEGNNISVLVDRGVCPMILDVLRTRLKFLNISVLEFDLLDGLPPMDNVAAVLYQTPDVAGRIVSNISRLASQCHDFKAKVIAITDPLALALYEPPGRQGADIVLGSSQRFGVPMGTGGPAAAYFAVTNELVRQLPGRLVAVAEDASGRKGYRLALQTREQHIRRENATSNICTAQSLPAVMAQFWVAYKGSDAIKALARKVYARTSELAEAARELGFSVEGENSWLRYGRHFGVVGIRRRDLGVIRKWAEESKLNFAYDQQRGVCRIHVDELLCDDDVYKQVLHALYKAARELSLFSCATVPLPRSPPVVRSTPFLDNDAWRNGRSDTEILRWVVELGNKDIGLQNSMIPLGSCTMKHNPSAGITATFTNPTLQNTHPLAPVWQTKGTILIASMLATFLCQITGLDHCSLQPNAGSAGEVAGLCAIREYHKATGQANRKICLVPASAHGTNSSSAVLSGFEVVEINLKPNGHIDLDHLRRTLDQYGSDVGCFMVTYPSTHGIFEQEVIEAARLVHQLGALVYIDGANMNAQMGLTNPGKIGADACHLNLHKTFGIPHGGGGPGVGPICVTSKLRDYLPSHRHFITNARSLQQMGLETGNTSGEELFSFTHAPLGSASLLAIPWVYLLMMGKKGLQRSSQVAILNANYLKQRLINAGMTICHGSEDYCGHEFVLDVKALTQSHLTEEDIAKRLMDYGYHAPTMSWPVRKALMIEPTECENKASLDGFADAIIKIAEESSRIASGKWPVDNNPVQNAPHTLEDMIQTDWQKKPYTLQDALFPIATRTKYWPPIGRTNGAKSDRALTKKSRN